MIRPYRIAALAMGLGLVLSPAADANSDPLAGAASFDIPAQPLNTALLAYSRQTGLQIVSSSQSLGGKRTAGVHGTHTARAALLDLLRGSGLSFRGGAGRTVTIIEGRSIAAAIHAPSSPSA